MNSIDKKETNLSPAELAAQKFELLRSQMEENSDGDNSAFKYQRRIKR